jgi:hypothetical protein
MDRPLQLAVILMDRHDPSARYHRHAMEPRLLKESRVPCTGTPKSCSLTTAPRTPTKTQQRDWNNTTTVDELHKVLSTNSIITNELNEPTCRLYLKMTIPTPPHKRVAQEPI